MEKPKVRRCCLPYLVQISVRKCDQIGTRWTNGTELCRAAVLIMPDQHPTVRELILANLPLLGLHPSDSSYWQHDRGLMVDNAFISLDTRLYPVFSERTLVLQLHKP